MTKRIFKSILSAAIGVLLASLILIMGVLYRYFTQIQLDQLHTASSLVAQGISAEGKDYFQGLKISNVRITWVDNLGNVLYDSKSDSAKMENHLKREEIKEALTEGYGESSRYSSTLTQRSFYVAQRLDNGTIVRLSVTQHSVLLLLLRMIQPIFLIVLLALILSILIARYTANIIVQPLNRLNLDQPLANDAYEELSPLLRRLDRHQREILHKKTLLARHQKEFDTIISKIKEGMILLDDQRRILSINGAALSLLEADEFSKGQDILEITRNLPLVELVDRGLKGQKCEGLVIFDTSTYRALIRPILADGKVTGLVLLLFDVSEQLQAEQMRREFTANVSHELKTPLHLISGYAEVLANNLVSKADAQAFSTKIYKESQRLMSLVEDIINLSQLDEAYQLTMEEVDLYQIAKNVQDTLLPTAQEKRVHLHLSGETSKLKGNPVLLYSVIYNLCDNAIKYNRENGDASIKVKPQTNKTILLEIEDTGIGIAKEDQDRIFERFYRVDKSRSKKVGGTGLGLSIVKHGLSLHNASIQVQSSLGKGTKMTITFHNL